MKITNDPFILTLGVMAIICLAVFLGRAAFLLITYKPKTHPTDYHGLRNLEDWTDETTCIHCGEPIVKNRGWCHLTFRSDSSGYTNCKAHKNRIYLDSDGGTSAEPDKKLFPDPPPHVYKHKIEISGPIYYDSIEDDTHITFSKDFKGNSAMIVRLDSSGTAWMNKKILFDTVPNGVSWWSIENN